MGPFPGCRRTLSAVTLSVALLASACTDRPAVTAPPRGAPTILEMARALGRDVVAHIARGYFPGRSGDILLTAAPWNVVGKWNNGLRGMDDPRTTHSSPWSYHQRVPIVLYGPGYVPAGERWGGSVDVTDLAPTFAHLLGFRFDARAGEILPGAFTDPALAPAEPPRVIVLVAYDGGGWNLLEQWPEAWPTLRGLAAGGMTYTNATVGSSPTLTLPIHANMGTGAYPSEHGLPVFYHRADPLLLRGPTVADAWDAANGNRPWVGLLAFESWHLPMMGKGARAPGGDRDVAIFWNRRESDFLTNDSAYRLPANLPEPTALDPLLRDLDAEDGQRDDLWMGNRLVGGDPRIIPGTPAFVEFQSDALDRLFVHEPIGLDELADFLFVELKSTDYAGHIWNMVNAEVGDVLEAQDRALARLVASLDQHVGRGRWVMAITADHGQTPVPTSTGGLRIDQQGLEKDIEAYFRADIVDDLTPTELYLDREAMEEAGISAEDVARYVGAYHYGDGLPQGTDVGAIPPSLLEEPVFAGALPASMVRSMTSADLAALGPGSYPEGDLTSPTGYGALLA